MDDTNNEEAERLFRMQFLDKLGPATELWIIFFHNILKRLITEDPVQNGGELLNAYEINAKEAGFNPDLASLRMHIGRLAQSAIIIEEAWSMFRKEPTE